MVHRLERFKTAYSQVEQLYYSATGTLSGITGSKISRDLQDYYIGSKKTRFTKPGFNAKKWERYYENRYNPYKKRFKGDVLVDEADSSEQQALRTDFPSNGVVRGNKQYRNRSRYGQSRSGRRGRCPNRVYYKGCVYRNVGKVKRSFTRN